jgi:arginase
MVTRRAFLTAASVWPLSAALSAGRPRRPLDLIEAPNALGLRPPAPGGEPGTYKAPAALARAGLVERLRPERVVKLARPRYTAHAQAGTRVRNGTTLRQFLLQLSAAVETSLRRGGLPLVVGGDCSNLLAGVAALRRCGGRGLVHVDGHSDFSHPGNDDARAHLGAAAGMDLALATGRGEALLTRWPEVDGPLVADLDAVQIGEREAGEPGWSRDLEDTAIERITVQWLKARGVSAAVERALGRLGERQLERAWLHIDLDVLDESVMPAVDSPGRPGLTYAELTALAGGLMRSGRIAGLDISIYDPDLDPSGAHARAIVACVAALLDEAAR